MVDTLPDSSNCTVELPKAQLKTMIKLVNALYTLHKIPAYADNIAAEIPKTALFDPGHDGVMMGYDFHLTPDGPRLIEVNTNAGGMMLAWQSDVNPRALNTLLNTFYKEMKLFSNNKTTQPKRLVIIDKEPQKQYLYPEMQQFAALFRSRGIITDVVDPDQLQADGNGVFYNGERVDFIYNRVCDFYLEEEYMAGIKAAYLNRAVCLSPNPRAYGLLADKRRLLLFNDKSRLNTIGLEPKLQKILTEVTPECCLLEDFEPEIFWQQRRKWVVKPVAAFGSRGVIVGKGISRARFATLDPKTTLVQQLIPPSTTICPWSEKPMKTDLRLFVYQKKILGVTARIYRGQVTSFKEPGSGYAPIKLI
ncbi:MAG: hypothetical protein HQL69_10510 [Magnetococcales bacterium]|nr:hypothetical protein [Magnetococcales bacterium]